MKRVRAGERALFEILMRRHNQRLYRAARSVDLPPREVDAGRRRSAWHTAPAGTAMLSMPLADASSLDRSRSGRATGLGRSFVEALWSPALATFG